MKLIVPLSLLLTFAVSGGEASVKCYFAARSPNSTLPSDAKVRSFTYPNTTAYCYKMYQIATSDDEGEVISYSWGALDTSTFSYFIKCNDTFEWTVESLQKDASYYYRYCLCCGTACNDADFDAKCPNNEYPKFTHKCYYAKEVNNKVLPEGSSKINCTESQACYKRSRYTEDFSNYEWGCASLGATGKCGGSMFVDPGDTTLVKGCTCCGDSCNGASMDDIGSYYPECGPAPSTTPRAPTTTSTATTTAVATETPGTTVTPSNSSATTGPTTVAPPVTGTTSVAPIITTTVAPISTTSSASVLFGNSVLVTLIIATFWL